MSRLPERPDGSEFLIYQAADGSTRVQVRVLDETVWLTQKQMAELFDKDVRTINEHLQNIFQEGELDPDSVIRNFRIPAPTGNPTTPFTTISTSSSRLVTGSGHTGAPSFAFGPPSGFVSIS